MNKELFNRKGPLAENEVKDLLKLYRVKTTKYKLVNKLEDLEKLNLKFPVALKVCSNKILHKTDIGGVKLGIKDLDELRKVLVQTNDLDEYTKFIDKSMKEMNRVLRKNKYCVIEVGDVAHKSQKLNLDELIVELSEKNNFKVKEILINYISSPKISKAFSEGAKQKGTKTNRCVIMKKK